MATFQNISEIERALSKGLRSIPNSPYFVGQIKEDLQKSIYDNVYSVPAGGYKRRYENGGLGDKNLFVLTNGDVKKSEALAEDLNGDDFMDTSPIDVDLFTLITEGSNTGTNLSITIYMEDQAPPTGVESYSLDFMVEHGKGRGNMSAPRPFYKPAEEIVESDGEYLSELCARIINQYL